MAKRYYPRSSKSRYYKRHNEHVSFLPRIRLFDTLIWIVLGVAAMSWLGPKLSGKEGWSLGSTSNASSSEYYPYCSDARAAGAAPLYLGDPGYRSELDADGDGVACEPYYGS